MKPKKELLEAARRDGSWERIDKVLSLAYLLHSEAFLLYDEVDDLLRSHGLLMGRTKQLSNRLHKAYDEYFKDFSELAGSGGDKAHNYFGDLDSLSRLIHEWANLPEKWEPSPQNENKGNGQDS